MFFLLSFLKHSLADVINNDNGGYLNGVPSSPAQKQKPPRPDPTLYTDRGEAVDDSIESRLQCDNMHVVHSSDESAQTSGNHVSWDMRDDPDNVSDSHPAKVSTLLSKVSTDPSPKSSPSTKKRKRPYHYPTESTDNSREDVTPQGSVNIHMGSQQEPVATYRPRDVHSYTQGHNIPTCDSKASDYYMRKYGRYRTGF